MSVSYTTTDLIESVKKRGGVPTSQSTFETDDFLRFGNEELQMGVVPFLMAIREEYFVTYTDTAVVNSQGAYDIPSRAIGGKLREIIYVGSGNQQMSLARIQVDEIPSIDNTINTGTPNYFYFQGNKLHVLPTPNSGSGTLRLYYFLRPNNLVPVNEAARIVSIDTGTNSIVVNELPTTMTTGTVCDFVQALPPFETLEQDTTITNVASTTITFASLPDGLAAGDYLCLQKESPVPQIPVELHSMLAQRMAIKCLESLGNREQMNYAQAKLDKMEVELRGLMANRVEGEPQKISNSNNIMGYFARRDWI